MFQILEHCTMNRQEKVLSEIGLRLKKLREDAGYTSYENFAIQHELSRMQYWRMENGKVNVTIKSLLTVLDIHSVTIEEFFRISPAMGMPVRSNALIAAEKNYSYASKAKRKKRK
jgi:transcriptional regulator with XRE-family HTH domain